MNDDTLYRKEEDVNSRRRYDSRMRDERARETRSCILAAAKSLFLQHGYVPTTMAGIAREAGVATQTVYVTFGTKRAILAAVMGEMIGGDDQRIGVLERVDPQRMREEPDQHRQLRMMAHGIREILDRAGPMLDVMRIAAASEVEIYAAYTELQEQRRENMASVVGWITDKGPLKSGLTENEAADVLWTLTSADVHRMLRSERGWTPERYEEWLAESLIIALLP
jgi:AcrR family transcriptional regulator